MNNSYFYRITEIGAINVSLPGFESNLRLSRSKCTKRETRRLAKI